jgi:hypothetical protein
MVFGPSEHPKNLQKPVINLFKKFSKKYYFAETVSP